jgi:predicted CopG family antitoxin
LHNQLLLTCRLSKQQDIFSYNPYNIAMLATKRIPVTETVWTELSELKRAGQTYSELLEEMIEDKKKARLFRDMEKIEEEGEFVEFPW